jgi:HSP20 family protein
MTNLPIRKQDGGTLARTGSVEWEPFRVMRELFGWDPFREMLPGVFGEERGTIFAPAFDVKETGDAFIFKADLPGVKDEDLEITFSGNRLIVRGKREAEQQERGETFYAYERSYGSFSRAFTVPSGVDADQCKADLRDGVLTLVLPKKPEAQPKRITVQGGEGGKARPKS